MSNNMSEANDTAISMMLGELRGQVRELSHTQNNMLQKLEAIGSQVMHTAAVPEQLMGMKTEYAALASRIAALELSNSQRAGREGVFSAVLHSPIFGWIVGGLTGIALYISGKLQL